MKTPINFNYVESVPMGPPNEHLSFLVLDKEKNDRYWKKVNSFNETLKVAREQNLDSKVWAINTAFIDDAVNDLLESTWNEELGFSTILGIPVAIVDAYIEPSCWLEHEPHEGIENTYWK
jgi:hypothetical protein